MEDRLGELYLEMTNLSIEAYEVERLGDVLKREDVELATLWRNQRPKREDYERTIPEFETLAVYEVVHDFAMPTDARDHRGHHFRRVPRPALGILSGEPTAGLEIVLVSSVNPGGVQALRDWADFLHIREIASAAVPGFTMITPYENVEGGAPRFMHFYETATRYAESALQSEIHAVPAWYGGIDTEAYLNWQVHDQLVVDYINTFELVGESVAP